MKLSEEQIKRITAKPQGTFRKSNMAKDVIDRIPAGAMEEILLKEGRAWGELRNKLVSNPCGGEVYS